MNSRHISLMFKVEDQARADLAFTPQRTYYRFATVSSIEDGELTPLKNFESTIEELLIAAQPRPGEQKLPADVRFELFLNDSPLVTEATEQSLRRVISALQPHNPEFSFLKGFM